MSGTPEPARPSAQPAATSTNRKEDICLHQKNNQNSRVSHWMACPNHKNKPSSRSGRSPFASRRACTPS